MAVRGLRVFVETERTTAMRLGTIECHVRSAKQRLRITAVLRKDRRSNTGPNGHTIPLEIERRAKGCHSARGKGFCAHRLLSSRLQDRKLISANPSDAVGGLCEAS